MSVSTKTAGTLLLGAAVIALGAACSSGNNNKNNAGNGPAVAPTVATVAVPATTVRTPTPAAAATVARTPTPAATSAAVRTPTPATASGTRAPTPAAGAATRAPSPGAAAGAGTTDPAVQAKLEAAALKQSDLPQGFTAQGEPDRTTSLPGQTASYSQTYTLIGQSTNGLNVQAIVVALTAFQSQTVAQASFKDLQQSIAESAGADITLTPITANPPKVGDETLAFQVSGQESGLNVAGFAIVWRRGKAAAALVQVGVPAPADISGLAALAAKQNDNLQSVSQ